MRRHAYLAMLMATLASCNQKDLCYEPSDHNPAFNFNVRAHWQLDWHTQQPGGPSWADMWPSTGDAYGYEDLAPNEAEGLRVVVYGANGNVSMQNIASAGGRVYMSAGRNSLLLYNNDTQYISFNNIGGLTEAIATSRALSRASYKGNSVTGRGDSEVTVSIPDHLFGAFLESYDAHSAAGEQYIDVTMRPLVYSYLIHYHFEKGIEHVALARGAMAGMSSGVYLTNGRTSDDAVTLLYDCQKRQWGAEAVVRTFGVPGFPGNAYAENLSFGASLEVRLYNGKMLTFDFDITDQVRRQPQGGVIEIFNISIPDDVAAESEGAFDVDVEGWGDYIDVPIIF